MRGKFFEKSVEESSVEENPQKQENMKMLDGIQNCCKCSASERKSTCPNFIRLELLREKAAIIQFVLAQNHVNSGINSVLLKELDIDEFMPMPLANYECCQQILPIAKLEMKMKAYETMLRKEKFGLADKFINDFNVDEESISSFPVFSDHFISPSFVPPPQFSYHHSVLILRKLGQFLLPKSYFPLQYYACNDQSPNETILFTLSLPFLFRFRAKFFHKK